MHFHTASYNLLVESDQFVLHEWHPTVEVVEVLIFAFHPQAYARGIHADCGVLLRGSRSCFSKMPTIEVGCTCIEVK